MLRLARYIIPLLFLTIFLGSCGKIEQLSAVPRIEFRNFTVFDTVDILGNHSKGARLLFYFEDGDGDLGLNQPTSVDSDTINLYLSLYRKINGAMVIAPPNDPLYRSGYRIPYMERLGQNKILRGTMKVSILYSAYTSHDTIMYDIKIKDRAGNESNVVSTCEIPLIRNGDCSVPVN